MNLKQYLKKKALSPKEFSEISKVSLTTIYRCLAGKGKIHLTTASLIEIATQGEVSVKENFNFNLGIKKKRETPI